jgi:hypothetical protein
LPLNPRLLDVSVAAKIKKFATREAPPVITMAPFEIDNAQQLIGFALYCGLAGAAVFVIDLLACKISSTKSFLGIVYRSGNSLLLLSLWTVGAALAGGVGAYLGVFQLTKTSVMAVGVAWPLMLSKFVKTSVAVGVSDDVEQDLDGEEDEHS